MASVDATFTRRKILRDELIGLFGVVERNLYLTKRYFLWDLAFLLWTIANTLTIVFISRGVDLSPAARNELATKLLVGGVIWAFLGIIFEIVNGDGRLGALGRDDRVHVHGARLAAGAPDRHGHLRRDLRARTRGGDLRRSGGVHRHPPAACELRRGDCVARDRLDLVHRGRDDDRRPAADLAGEGGRSWASSRKG